MFLTAKKNKEMSSDEKESEGKDENNDSEEILESSYELFTPIKTRSAKSVGRLSGSPRATHTRSGRKIKRIQYLEYESEFNDPDDQKSLPNKSKAQTSEKNSALKELNSLKNEFNDLRISSSKISTPTTRSKVARMNETPVKGDLTPRGKIISPEIIYSRSGRKIKRIQYSENQLDSASPGVNLRKGSLKLQDSLKKDNVSSAEFVTPTKKRLMQHKSSNTPKSKNALFPLQTKIGSKLKNLQHIDEIEKPKENEGMEICSQESLFKKNGALSERNNEISILETTFTPSKNGAKDKTLAKLRKIPKENASPNSIYTKSGRKVKKKHYLEDSYQETESSDEEVSNDFIKPTALYDDDNAVGKQIFGFQTPKHRNAMLEKASRSANKLNSAQKTPKSNKNDKINEHKTPYNMRKRLKKGIAKEVSRQSIDAFLEDSGSDYVPSSSCSDVSEEEEEDEDDYEKGSGESSDGYEISGVIPLEKAIDMEKMVKKKRRAAINNFIFTSEDYFENKNVRSLTSNHTLSQLTTPRFNQGQLSEILKSIGSKHEKTINELNLENEAMFTRWLLSMNEGFNVLVYGVGSKKKLLNVFHRQFLSRCYVAVVNGYFPGLVLKDILDCITNDVLRLRRSVPSQPHDIVEFIGTKLRIRNNRLFLLVHNIDGTSLRCDKIQLVLAHLAADPNIHLVATLDHINSPLLWDQNKLSLFNFTWEDGTSFLPYTNETSYESSLMVQQSGGIALAGLKNIFKSLNTNSRRIFKLLLEHQLEDNSSKSQGMLFKELYRECRNSFLVSSDLALRTQLTEFFDHQLVKWKKDSEHLVIPMDSAVLKQFQNYLNSENAL